MNIPEQAYQVFKGKTQTFVLMLHGLGLNKTAFSGTAAVLKEKNISFINIDLPGHGYAFDIRIENYSGFSDYIGQILDIENINRVVVMGYSIGGMVGLYLSKQWPERVKGLITIASPYEITTRTVRPLFIALGFPFCVLINTVVRLFAKTNPAVDFSKPSIMNNDLAMLWWSSIATSGKGANMAMKAIGSKSLLSCLEHMQCSYLMVAPKRDQFFSQKCYNLMIKLSGGQSLTVEGNHNIIPILWSITEAILTDYPEFRNLLQVDAS